MKHWVFILLIALALPLRAQTNAAAAMQKIGDMYMEGRNTPKDSGTAGLWCSLAAAHDAPGAAAKLARAQKTLTVGEWNATNQRLPHLVEELNSVGAALRANANSP